MYGKKYYNKTSQQWITECNPGIPCNYSIQNFANEYKCQIIVDYATFLPETFKPNNWNFYHFEKQ